MPSCCELIIRVNAFLIPLRCGCLAFNIWRLYAGHSRCPLLLPLRRFYGGTFAIGALRMHDHALTSDQVLYNYNQDYLAYHPTPTPTNTPSQTKSPSMTPSPSTTPTPTGSASISYGTTPSVSPTVSSSLSSTATVTPSATITPHIFVAKSLIIDMQVRARHVL